MTVKYRIAAEGKSTPDALSTFWATASATTEAFVRTDKRSYWPLLSRPASVHHQGCSANESGRRGRKKYDRAYYI